MIQNDISLSLPKNDINSNLSLLLSTSKEKKHKKIRKIRKRVKEVKEWDTIPLFDESKNQISISEKVSKLF